MRVTLVSVGLAVVLAACQTAYQGNENSPYYVVPVDSRLILTQEIGFDRGQVSIYVQNGKILRFAEVQKYDPFCKFELFHLIETARTIAPDEIRVIKAFQEHKFDTFARTGMWHYAQLSARHLAQSGSFGDGGPSLQSFTVQMDLRSSAQPEIFRMTCARWAAYPSAYEHLSITEIRQTLSPLFTLRTPANR